jgi:hypothetical protein
MAFHSGNGGGVTVNGGSENNVGRWEINATARLVEVTHSGTSGASNYEKVVMDCSATIEIPVDDANLPDTDMLFVPGTKITLVGQMGGSGKTATLTNTTVETCTYVNDPQSDIVRARVNTKGGSYTAPTT